MDRLPENKLPALRVMTMPADANQNGDIFGGWIMSHRRHPGGILAAHGARPRGDRRRRSISKPGNRFENTCFPLYRPGEDR